MDEKGPGVVEPGRLAAGIETGCASWVRGFGHWLVKQSQRIDGPVRIRIKRDACNAIDGRLSRRPRSDAAAGLDAKRGGERRGGVLPVCDNTGTGTPGGADRAAPPR